MQINIIQVGGRKFLLAAASLLLSSLLVYLAKIDGGVYATIVVATVASYITGNVAQKTNLNKSTNDQNAKS